MHCKVLIFPYVLPMIVVVLFVRVVDDLFFILKVIVVENATPSCHPKLKE